MNELSAWLLTYLVHSTLLIGGVLLALRAVDVRSLAWREALWMVALFGAPLTATVQRVGAAEPLLGAFELRGRAGTAQAAGADAAPGDLPVVPHGVAPETGPTRAPDADSARREEPAGGASGRLTPVEPPPGAVVLVLAVSGALVVWLLWSLRGLAGRRRLDDGPLARALARLCAAHGPRRRVRLSTSARLDSPVAFGFLRPEICVPERGTTDLTPPQQEAMLAHELAHVVRWDPLRLLLARLVEAVLFLQPLNRLARRRLFETVERRCDAWALARTGRGLALAECLAEVAGWIHERRAPVVAAAMAEPGSPLGRRIEDLLAPERTLADDRRRRGLAPLATLLLPALVVAAPTVRSAAAVAAPPAGTTAEARSAADARPVPTDDALAAAVAEAIDLLGAETETLVDEVRELRAALPPGGRVDPDLLRAFAEVERRIERMKSRRDRLAAWKDEMLREHGLARPQPNDTASPRSGSR